MTDDVAMPLKVSIVAADDAERHQLETMVTAGGRATLAGRPMTWPPLVQPSDPVLRQLAAQLPDAVVLAPPPASPEQLLGLIEWMHRELPLASVVACGPSQPASLIVSVMRAGAAEYLAAPLSAAAWDDAVRRLHSSQGPQPRPGARGKLIAVLGARGGCGATTVATNLAFALQDERRQDDGEVILVDAAPLGHAALHLNLKPRFQIRDLLANLNRLDSAMLGSLMMKHASGLQLLAGIEEPLAAEWIHDDTRHGGWIDCLVHSAALTVVDLSARHDAITRAVVEHADRILLVAQTDMVSLWSAAKVRQWLDPQQRMQFELVLNRYTVTPEVEIAGLEKITHAPVFWRLPNAHAEVMEAIERGRPAVQDAKSELARSLRELATTMLGRPVTKKKRSWLPFGQHAAAPTAEPLGGLNRV